MPDSIAAQNLCDALKAFIGSPAAHSPYSVAKDFQTLLAGVLALIVASIGYVIAFRGAKLAYRGVMDRIEFDRETIETERKAAERDRMYGAFLRLRSQMLRLKNAAKWNGDDIESSLKVAEGRAVRVEWKDEYIFGDFDELEKAWKKIDLFPMGAIYLIDALRSRLASTREDTARCLKDRNEDGTIPFVDAILYRHHCKDIELKAIELFRTLRKPTMELATIGWPERIDDQ